MYVIKELGFTNKNTHISTAAYPRILNLVKKNIAVLRDIAILIGG